MEAQKQLRTARANWARIHQREQELHAELGQLEKNFLQGPETVTRLSAIYEFFEAGSDTRLQTYLNHLRQMAVEQPGRQRRN